MHALKLPWMPQEGLIELVSAGRWWDAIAVPQTLGLDVLEHLDTRSGRHPGPVIWEPYAANPCLYFLVPAGAAPGWDVPGTRALGVNTYVGVPGPTFIEPPGPHWLAPPDPDDPGALVDADALRKALLGLMAAGGTA